MNVPLVSLLELLPPDERERLRPHLTRVRLECGQTLIWPNEPLTRVYFPIDCLVSVVSHGQGREAAETGLVGREGVGGLALFLGAEATPHRLVCQVQGEATYRWTAGA